MWIDRTTTSSEPFLASLNQTHYLLILELAVDVGRHQHQWVLTSAVLFLQSSIDLANTSSPCSPSTEHESELRSPDSPCIFFLCRRWSYESGKRGPVGLNPTLFHPAFMIPLNTACNNFWGFTKTDRKPEGLILTLVSSNL